MISNTVSHIALLSREAAVRHALQKHVEKKTAFDIEPQALPAGLFFGGALFASPRYDIRSLDMPVDVPATLHSYSIKLP